MGDVINKEFSAIQTVENRCHPHLKPIFETFLLKKKCKQQDLADFLGLDKAYISRMVNGVIVPPLRIRLKVAEFFCCDSALIWRMPKVQTADKLEVAPNTQQQRKQEEVENFKKNNAVS